MSRVIIDPEIIRHNFRTLDKLFTKYGIAWTAVTKVVCGHKPTLKLLVDLGLRSFADSRLDNLKTLRKLCPDAETMYIRPTSPKFASNIVKWADISLNTEFKTIKALSDAAQKQDKKHGVIIMVELGELREGIMPDRLIGFYRQVFELEGIEVLGIGTNLACMYGVLPTYDKLMQLALYKRLVELTFNTKLRWCSGGSTVTIPNILEKQLPREINHYRVGEALFLGTDLVNGGYLKGLKPDAFKLSASIVELKEKPTGPLGEMGENAFGEEEEAPESGEWGHGGERKKRAVLNIGRLDVPFEHLTPFDQDVEVVGGASDLVVADISESSKKYKLGDEIRFKLDYAALLALMHSRYIEEEIVTTPKAAK
ncbi:alanine/ornithine racemase family PLP-dependent enzyme [candidate division WOR-3 bacterium]|uniref:Alanine/ornithine racemase family PLP-dependent enzyme n=1 Tax=candidate division WOR-3 bacterium TaxID=2052148 RepID=A0A9D5K7L9_UNCW3|nr:alanine/ornithine racemase family PLP-dependent enzyme [candidate division WOR-3 bacterium]MBD3363752.1 alanine/ornithine racemase family PLP-dependent enzyme [candidate division WOR-3 bacterium]